MGPSIAISPFFLHVVKKCRHFFSPVRPHAGDHTAGAEDSDEGEDPSEFVFWYEHIAGNIEAVSLASCASSSPSSRPLSCVGGLAD